MFHYLFISLIFLMGSAYADSSKNRVILAGGNCEISHGRKGSRNMFLNERVLAIHDFTQAGWELSTQFGTEEDQTPKLLAEQAHVDPTSISQSSISSLFASLDRAIADLKMNDQLLIIN